MKLLQHFITITKHRNKVLVHCIKAGIPIRGLLHDLSKYSPEEFIPGVLYYQGTRSPNEGEREAYGHSIAWMHHKGRNKHHFEYWTDYDPKTKKVEAVKMPLKYVKEMFCDRVAASKNYKGKAYKDSDAYDYYMKSRSHYIIHPDTAALLEKLLKKLRDEGEEKTIDYIRREILKNKK